MKPLIVGNWKMHKTAGEAVAFVRTLLTMELDLSGAEAVVCPPFTALHAVRAALGDAAIGLGAQTMHAAASGAFTGEISAAMLLDAGVAWVILGHSERRAANAETDATVNAGVHAALAAGIVPIVAVGENAADHAAGRTEAHVLAQARAAFAGVGAADAARCVVAYEPIWAIGSGSPDTPPNADAVMGAIRTSVEGLDRARLLYGGSVKPENVAAFVAQPHIDGALVGGASLDPASFAALVRLARKGAPA